MDPFAAFTRTAALLVGDAPSPAPAQAALSIPLITAVLATLAASGFTPSLTHTHTHSHPAVASGSHVYSVEQQSTFTRLQEICNDARLHHHSLTPSLPHSHRNVSPLKPLPLLSLSPRLLLLPHEEFHRVYERVCDALAEQLLHSDDQSDITHTLTHTRCSEGVVSSQHHKSKSKSKSKSKRGKSKPQCATTAATPSPSSGHRDTRTLQQLMSASVSVSASDDTGEEWQCVGRGKGTSNTVRSVTSQESLPPGSERVKQWELECGAGTDTEGIEGVSSNNSVTTLATCSIVDPSLDHDHVECVSDDVACVRKDADDEELDGTIVSSCSITHELDATLSDMLSNYHNAIDSLTHSRDMSPGDKKKDHCDCEKAVVDLMPDLKEIAKATYTLTHTHTDTERPRCASSNYLLLVIEHLVKQHQQCLERVTHSHMSEVCHLREAHDMALQTSNLRLFIAHTSLATEREERDKLVQSAVEEYIRCSSTSKSATAAVGTTCPSTGCKQDT